MKTTERVLELLEQNRGSAVSGEELAKILGVSRNAVWKAIEDLRRGGVKIYAKTKKGRPKPATPDCLHRPFATVP